MRLLRYGLIAILGLTPILLVLRSPDLAITFGLSAVGALGVGSILTALLSLIRRIEPSTFPVGPELAWAARVGLGALAVLCFVSVLILVVAAVDQVLIATTGRSLILPA